MNFILDYYFDFKNSSSPTATSDALLNGFWITIKLSIISGILALTWGLILAVAPSVARARARRPCRWLTIGYIDVFRGHPAAARTAAHLRHLGLRRPDRRRGAAEVDRIARPGSARPSPFWYGVFALTITYGAYMAEVYRAGIEAVPRGQMEAARSLGMSHGQSMRYVIVPQAVRKVIPPLLNDFIALMKDTSLVSVLGAVEVVQAGRDIQSDVYNGSGLMMGAILFLIVTIPLARLVDWLIAREQRKRTARGGADGGDGDWSRTTRRSATGGGVTV